MVLVHFSGERNYEREREIIYKVVCSCPFVRCRRRSDDRHVTRMEVGKREGQKSNRGGSHWGEVGVARFTAPETHNEGKFFFLTFNPA